jgi:CO dehydrogenase maturation factor
VTRVIATAGKGGTGKTTTAAMITRVLVEAGTRPVLAVDADANANLGELLGIEVDRTLGGVREDFMVERSGLPPGMTKEAFLEMKLMSAVVETDDVDMLVMGRPEGQGCYCAANNVLRAYMEKLQDNYPVVMMDNEAGLEHISRLTTRKPDALLLVTDHARRGIEAAHRIRGLIDELGLSVATVGLVINRVPASGLDPRVEELVSDTGLELLATLPEDDEVARFDLEHRSVFELPGDNAFVSTVQGLVERLQLTG